jgi:hypothetical protein
LSILNSDGSSVRAKAGKLRSKQLTRSRLLPTTGASLQPIGQGQCFAAEFGPG